MARGASATPSKSERHGTSQTERAAATVDSLQHIDQVTDFHRKLSLSLDHSHNAPGSSLSVASEPPGLTDASRGPSYAVRHTVYMLVPSER